MIDPDKIYHEVSEAGMEWADKKAAYEALDDNTKSILAQIKSTYLDQKLSNAEAETRALIYKDYRDHLTAVALARKAWLVAQVKYDCLKMLSELRRSEESSRRAEMKL